MLVILNLTSAWKEWRHLATPGMGTIVVKGIGFTLNIGEEWMVVNYAQDEGNNRQLIKPIIISEFNYLYGK